MEHIPSLITDLAIILLLAGVVTIIFKFLKQPVVLGYIVAGVLAGPAFQQTPTVANPESIRIWADIGVIFLLFALGIDFSVKKILKVGGAAVIGAITIMIGMMSVGYMTGMLMGWGHMNSLFLGGMLSMSSTTIIFKAFDDMGLRNRQFAGVVLGILVMEDLFAVLMMVLLSTLAVSQHVEGMELINSVIKLGGFLLFSFVVGIFVIPSFLRKTKKYMNDETLLIFSIGLCLGMVLLATKAGFSSALGAFLMGSILAETIEAEHIESLVIPVKNLFGAIFFVSVGMLIDPAMLWTYKWPILVITIIVMCGQVTFGTFGVLLSGKSLKVAMQSGFSLAQIGEFAFILASLGLSLGVTADFLYPIVVAVSVITTFFTPYMMKASEPAFKFVERKAPKRLIGLIDRNSSGSNTIGQKSTWNKLLKALLKIVSIYLGIALVLLFIWLHFISPILTAHITGLKGNILSAAIIILLISPLLRAIMMRKNHSDEYQQLWNDNKYNRGPLISLIAIRIILCTGLVMIPIINLLNVKSGMAVAIASITIAMMIFSKKLKQHSIALEKMFLSNLTARDIEEERKAPIKQRFANSLLKRDLHLADFEVAQNSPSIGKTLRELDFRKMCNVNVVTIIRGDDRINIPGGQERIYPFDKLIVVGTDQDLIKFKNYIDERYKAAVNDIQHSQAEVNIEQFMITADSPFNGKTILESGIRDKAGCLVVGVERGETSIQNPIPSTILLEGDVVWVVGEREKVVLLSEGIAV